jgi:hypothetical protein
MDPFTLLMLSAALTGGSMVANKKAADTVARERRAVARRAREDRQVQERKARTALGSTEQTMSQLAAQEKVKAGELAREMIAQQGKFRPPNPETQALIASVDPRVVRQTASEVGKGQAYNAQQAQQLAKLMAFGDVAHTAGITAGRNAEDIGRYGGNIRRYSETVLPAEMQYAMTRGGGYAALGDVLQTAAMLTSMAGLTGTGAAAKAGTSVGGITGQAAKAPIGLKQFYMPITR